MSKIFVLEIGPWNMDDDKEKKVSHSIDNLVGGKPEIGVIVKNDSNTLCYGAVIYDGAMPNGVIVDKVTSKLITLRRSCCGMFDNSNFNDTVINRGFIKISM